MTAYKTKVWTGTEWAEIATAVTNLDGYWAKSEYPGRNLLYNGAMQIAQRNTSVASISSGATYHTVDRFQTAVNALGTWTQSVENDAPTGSGLRKSLKMLITTADASPAADDYVILMQNLEGQDVQRIFKGTSSAQQLTLSFWVKSNVTGTYIVSLFDTDNSRSIHKSYSVSSSATWEKKTIVFDADTVGMFDNDNSGSLSVRWWLGVGSNRNSGTLGTIWASTVDANSAVGQTNVAAATNNYWQITGVQLETGSTATPFEFEPYETTLRKCYRYYWKLQYEGAPTRMLYGHAASTTAWNSMPIYPPTPMRVTPVTIGSGTFGISNGYQYEATSVPGTSFSTYSLVSSPTCFGIQITDRSGLVQFRPMWVEATTAGSTFAFNAEL